MCGIAGIVEIDRCADDSALQSIIDGMTATLRHRGPDDQGTWIEGGAALGHRRLSIIDLSAHGHQPMVSASGRFVMVYNGEIYNFRILRKELAAKGHEFHGHSDSEVLLAAIESWGLERALRRSTGMFALAVWDRKERALSLCRDRLGEKPLYYGFGGSRLLFASELKALRSVPDWQATIDKNSLALFIRHGYVPCPYSIYSGIFKLLPGCLVHISEAALRARWRISPFASSRSTGGVINPELYWSAQEVAEHGSENLRVGPAREIVDELESLLTSAVAGQMVADVPLGALLSGGIDSTTIVALMQSQSPGRIKTFTIGFDEAHYNEAQYAKSVAQHLGTDHTEMYVTSQDAMDVIPELTTIYDEPFADSSQIPTLLVSKLARSQVTVSLSGDGGDELFGGYNRYLLGQSIWRTIGWLPADLRKMAAIGLGRLPPRVWMVLFEFINKVLPIRMRQANPADKMQKALEILGVSSEEELYLGIVSMWKQPLEIVPGAEQSPNFLTDRSITSGLSDFRQKMMLLDTLSYLPGDILTKVDRASMSESLELRVPFLDHRVVEFAWSVPTRFKIRRGTSKWLLRQVLQKYVPAELIDRPKMGFGVPIDTWLRGPLMDWADDLLSTDTLRKTGYLSQDPILKKWHEHKSGQRNWQYYLWNILVFQSWCLETK